MNSTVLILKYSIVVSIWWFELWWLQAWLLLADNFDLSWNQINTPGTAPPTPTTSTITRKCDDIFQFRGVREFPWNRAMSCKTSLKSPRPSPSSLLSSSHIKQIIHIFSHSIFNSQTFKHLATTLIFDNHSQPLPPVIQQHLDTIATTESSHLRFDYIDSKPRSNQQ